MRINYEGNLKFAKILLSKSRDRPDYLNSFLENSYNMLRSKATHFNGDFEMPTNLVQEPDKWFKGPYVDVKASDNRNSVIFAIPLTSLEYVDRNPETLEKIIGTFAEFEEKPNFKKVSTKRKIGELDDTGLDLLNGEYIVTEIDADKISFIPIEKYRHNTNVTLTKDGAGNEQLWDMRCSQKSAPKAVYLSNQWDKRIVNVRIFGGNNLLDVIPSYRLSKKLKKEMPEAKIYWSGLGLDNLMVNEGYEWNRGKPIIWTPETRAERKRLDRESAEARRLIIQYLKTNNYRIKDGATKQNAFKYARDLVANGISSPEVVAGASILKGIEASVSDSVIMNPFLPMETEYLKQLKPAQDTELEKEVVKIVDFFHQGKPIEYRQSLTEALQKIA